MYIEMVETDAFQLLIGGVQFVLTFGIYTSWKNIKRIEEDNKRHQIKWEKEMVSYKEEMKTLYKLKPSH
jgi:hypothetical protein